MQLDGDLVTAVYAALTSPDVQGMEARTSPGRHNIVASFLEGLTSMGFTVSRITQEGDHAETETVHEGVQGRGPSPERRTQRRRQEDRRGQAEGQT